MATDRRGAAYARAWDGSGGEANWTDDSDADRNEHSFDGRCAGCGARVSERFRRVFGDNNDVVRSCPECGPNRHRARGGGGKEVRDDIL